jgi:hypothetical protein
MSNDEFDNAKTDKEIMKRFPHSYLKRKPTVWHDYPDLPRNNSPKFHNVHFKTRIIQYTSTPQLLDIRHFTLDSGYSPIGLSFTIEQLELLQEIIPDAIKKMKSRIKPLVNPDKVNKLIEEIVDKEIPPNSFEKDYTKSLTPNSILNKGEDE